jgi:dihydroorotate dehydrogenase (fumarate)
MDTRTSYLGIQLPHPFMAGASPLGYHLDSIKRLEDAGGAAIVLHSLFEEQITSVESGRVAHMSVFDPVFEQALALFPGASEYPLGPDEYAEHVHQAKRTVAVPVIASLNGRTAESWLKFARIIEQAGADAIELNMYDVSADFSISGAAIESRLVGVVGELKRLLRIPLAVKLSPFFTAFANTAHRLDDAGADGLVLFNRFYQPDVDITSLSVASRTELSTSAELLLRLRWVAILHGRVRSSLALTGGVASPEDGIKAVLAGADVVQMVSALLRHGADHIGVMRRGLETWMDEHHLPTLLDVRGAVSLKKTNDPSLFERAHYIRALHNRLIQE